MTVDWLEAKRTVRGLSQDKLADLVGVHRSYVTKIERGLRRPSVAVAQRLGEILGFRWPEFFGHLNSQQPPSAFVPQIVLVSFENSSDDHPHTIIEESLLFRPDLAISRFEKHLETGEVTFWVRRVKQLENSIYYQKVATFPDLTFQDSRELLQDMTRFTFVEFLNKYFAEDAL